MPLKLRRGKQVKNAALKIVEPKSKKSNSKDGQLEYTVPALASFKVAAVHLGASSRFALHMRFSRGNYPKRFLVQITPEKKGVDLHGLIAWIRQGRPDAE